MPVVQFKVAVEPGPVLVTIYGVQSYWRDRAKLVEGKFEQFANMEMALRAGRTAGRRSPLVRVFRIKGNPEVGYWEEAVTVAKFGDDAATANCPWRSVCDPATL